MVLAVLCSFHFFPLFIPFSSFPSPQQQQPSQQQVPSSYYGQEPRPVAAAGEQPRQHGSSFQYQVPRFTANYQQLSGDNRLQQQWRNAQQNLYQKQGQQQYQSAAAAITTGQQHFRQQQSNAYQQQNFRTQPHQYGILNYQQPKQEQPQSEWQTNQFPSGQRNQQQASIFRAAAASTDARAAQVAYTQDEQTRKTDNNSNNNNNNNLWNFLQEEVKEETGRREAEEMATATSSTTEQQQYKENSDSLDINALLNQVEMSIDQMQTKRVASDQSPGDLYLIVIVFCRGFCSSLTH